LWWRAIGGGDPQRLSFGTGDYAEPRISADGRTLVATRYELRQSLARVALTPAAFGRMTTVTDGYGGDLDPSISPAGDRMVFSSSRYGARNLWTARVDGGELRPLTSGNAQDDRPMFSPDGRQIAFNSDRDGRRGIWVIGSDGGTPRKVADVSPTGGLSWSPDGKSVIYAAGQGGWPGLWSVSVENGQVRRIATPGAVSEPAWNPARDLIAYLEPATSGPGNTRLSFLDSAGRPQFETVPPSPAISGGFGTGMLAWSPDGRLLAVVSQNSNAAASIWIVDPVSAMPFRKLVQLPVGPRVRGVSWTRDGAAIIIGQHDTLSDIVLLAPGR
jgi:Tol biopolymer transport system component